jgi:F-type H+-transporting ATPase subunit b
MQIDWFTVVAQIVNFLILVGLLKKFLYGPIIRAMDDRERRIASRLEEANAREQEAQEEIRAHRAKREELEDTREDALAQAREEAEKTRHELISSARAEVRGMQQQWRQALRDEQKSFLRDLRGEVGKGVCEITARVMRDLANERLQDHIVEVFLDRARDVEGDGREALLEAIGEAGGQVTVRSTFELGEKHQQRVTQLVRDTFAENGTVAFEQDDGLICGLELRAGGRRLSWNVDDYLGAVAESLTAALEEEVGSDGE